MRLKALYCLLATLLALAFTTASRAQLPDQRGETYIATGNLFVSGVAFGIDFADLASGGIDFVKVNKARLIISNTGTETNTVLTGTFRFPVFPATNYPTVSNPEIPMTGSFDRSSGSFTMSGALAGTTIIDFGVTNLGAAFGGNKRIQVRLQSLAIAITGTGAITNGQFKITQSGTANFVYPNLPPQVRLCIQDPNLTTFGGAEDNVTNSSIVYRNGLFFQPAIRGTIALEGVPNIGLAVQPVGPVFLQFTGANGNQVRPVILGSDGTYTAYVNPDVYSTIKAKNPNWLRKLLASNVDLNRDDVGGINGTLLAGDANNDNAADIMDLSILIAHYNQTAPANGYSILCDFNRDGTNDIGDLLLLIGNYNKLGD